jgi:hypothetical protein
MFTESIDKVTASHKRTRRHHFLSLLIAFVFGLMIYPTQANAQIIGDVEANIPFQFHAGNTKFPAGQYRIYVLDNTDLSVMEISSMDDSMSAVFQVRDAETKSDPTKTELIFNKYGNRYFLAELFDEGNPNGSQVLESQYEKRISQAMPREAQHTCRQGTEGNKGNSG